MDFARQLEEEMICLGHDGRRFTEMVTKSVAERKKKGIADRRNRYIHYCQWAHALKRHGIGPEGVQYSYPELMLKFIRSLCPKDIKGEIREDAYSVTLEEFCRAMSL